MKLRPAALLLASLLAAALVGVALRMPAGQAAVTVVLAKELPATGAAHAVTGVLLGFRAYDTLLEVFVLLLAVLGADTARAARGRGPLPGVGAGTQEPVLRALVDLAVPLMVLVGGYLLWAGTSAPGGAFQAAAVLGAAGVLLRLASLAPAPDPQQPAVRWGLAAGPALFLAVFAMGVLPAMLLAVEAALTLSIGLALFCLFAGPRR